jgi:hypothetical protein
MEELGWGKIPKKENNMKIEGEQKYFTAEEARQVSDEINSENMKKELDWIYDLINNARFEGEHSITFSNKSLMKATSEFIKSKGFKISHISGTQWDPADDTTISW